MAILLLARAAASVMLVIQRRWADCLLRRLQCSGTLLRPGHDLQYLQLQ